MPQPYVHELRVRYSEVSSAGRFDEQLQLHARLTRLGTTAITAEIDVTREGELLAQGMLRHVCVASDTWSKTELPQWVHDGLERFLCPEAKSSRGISSQGAGTSSAGA